MIMRVSMNMGFIANKVKNILRQEMIDGMGITVDK